MYKNTVNRFLTGSVFVIIALFIQSKSANAEFWNLPQEISPASASILFEVDSTWHVIKGKTDNFSGKVWLEDKTDFRSLRGNIHLPVASFDTDNKSRDERLREVMHAEQNPFVEFKITSFDSASCDPTTLMDQNSCQAVIFGDITINGISKNIALNTSIEKSGTSYKVDGTSSLKWSDFKVDDPSIIIAKLYEDVIIHIQLTLPYKG